MSVYEITKTLRELLRCPEKLRDVLDDVKRKRGVYWDPQELPDNGGDIADIEVEEIMLNRRSYKYIYKVGRVQIREVNNGVIYQIVKSCKITERNHIIQIEN